MMKIGGQKMGIIQITKPKDSKEKKDIAIRQSLSSGSKVAVNTSISITLSNGKATTTNNSKSNTNNSNNNKSNNNQNNNNNNQSNNNFPTFASQEICGKAGLISCKIL